MILDGVTKQQSARDARAVGVHAAVSQALDPDEAAAAARELRDAAADETTRDALRALTRTREGLAVVQTVLAASGNPELARAATVLGEVAAQAARVGQDLERGQPLLDAVLSVARAPSINVQGLSSEVATALRVATAFATIVKNPQLSAVIDKLGLAALLAGKYALKLGGAAGDPLGWALHVAVPFVASVTGAQKPGGANHLPGAYLKLAQDARFLAAKAAS